MSSSDISPQQIGKAFVVQYYRLLHEHPESLYRFYSSSSTLMHDDPDRTATGIENITKRIEELSLKHHHVKIRQVDCHSTVNSSVVVQVCGEISSQPVVDNQNSVMKRFVQTFILAPTENNKQKYYVHNDIFRYQENPIVENKTSTNENEVTTFENVSPKPPTVQTPTSSMNIQFTNSPLAKRAQASSTTKTSDDQVQKSEEKEASTKPKSYRDAIGKKEKPPANPTTQENLSTPAGGTTKESKSSKKKASKSGNRNARSSRGHPQDTTDDYYDDSWCYGNEEGYLYTGYIDDQEVFVRNLSAQVTEQEIRALFRPYGNLLHIRIGNTGSQVGAANFAFVVCQSIDMAKAIVADHEKLLKNQQVHVEAKKRRPFSHTFRPTYPTAALPTNYQSTGYPAAAAAAAATTYDRSSTTPFYGGGVPGRGGQRGGRGGTKS